MFSLLLSEKIKQYKYHQRLLSELGKLPKFMNGYNNAFKFFKNLITPDKLYLPFTQLLFKTYFGSDITIQRPSESNQVKIIDYDFFFRDEIKIFFEAGIYSSNPVIQKFIADLLPITFMENSLFWVQYDISDLIPRLYPDSKLMKETFFKKINSKFNIDAQFIISCKGLYTSYVFHLKTMLQILVFKICKLGSSFKYTHKSIQIMIKKTRHFKQYPNLTKACNTTNDMNTNINLLSSIIYDTITKLISP